MARLMVPRSEKTHVFESMRTIVGKARTGYIKVTACLNYIEGNKDPYFSVTAEGREFGSEFGGCCHDRILQEWPELAPVVALHLATFDGVPMHAEANGLYHIGIGRYGEYNLDHLASHFRLSVSDAVELARVVTIADGLGCAADAMHAYCQNLELAWADEAFRAMCLLDRLEAANGAN